PPTAAARSPWLQRLTHDRGAWCERAQTEPTPGSRCFRGPVVGTASEPRGHSWSSPSLAAASVTASVVSAAVFLADVAVALALLLAGLFAAVFLAPDAAFFAVLVACVRVVFALAVVVLAASVASRVDGWRRIRSTTLSPRR